MRAVSTAISRSRAVARRAPPSKMGTESETKPRHVRDGGKSADGVSSCGSNEAVAVGTQSRQLSPDTRDRPHRSAR